MRPTKFDQEQVNPTLRSEVRVKYQRKFELFAVTRTLTWLHIPSLSPKLKEMGVFNAVHQLCNRFKVKNQ